MKRILNIITFFCIFSPESDYVQVPKYIKKPILDSNEKYEK